MVESPTFFRRFRHATDELDAHGLAPDQLIEGFSHFVRLIRQRANTPLKYYSTLLPIELLFMV